MNSHHWESQILRVKSNWIQPDHKYTLKKYEQLNFYDQNHVTFFLNPELDVFKSTKRYPYTSTKINVYLNVEGGQWGNKY